MFPGKAAAAGLLLACIVSFATPGAYGFYRFKVHGDQKQRETAAVQETIKLFSAYMAGFYATDGNLAGLNAFPAEKMVKRRIFHDIRNWEAHGKMLVMDRDRTRFGMIRFLAPDLVSAQVDENWFSVFQDYTTRRQISTKRANFVTIRYYLKKTWGRWIVLDYEVFKQGDILPPVAVEKVLKWR